MSVEDDYDIGQYPDFLDAMPGLEGRLFPQREEKVDKDGYVECAFLPLRDIVLFPQMVMPLFVGRERSLAALHAAVEKNENLIVAAQKDSNILDPAAKDLFTMGTEITVGKALRMPDDSTSVLAQGRRRIEIVEFTQWDPYIRVRARPVSDDQSYRTHQEHFYRHPSR